MPGASSGAARAPIFLSRSDAVRLLVTRPVRAAARTAEKLEALGHEVLVAPLLRIERLDQVEIGSDPFEAIVMTSANAAAALANHPRSGELRALPVFVVGRRTAEAARAAGFANVISAEGNQQDLVGVLRKHFSGSRPDRIRPLIYLAGADRAGDIAGELAREGIAVRTVIVYRAVAVDTFPPAVRDAFALGKLDGVLHFSRRTAEAFVVCARACALLDAACGLEHFCLSDQVAEPLSAAGARSVRVAARPQESVLIELMPRI
jgi:uroporphyrinogen-III synthase